MKIRMELQSDAIFGNGMSVPGGEDISVLHDKDGFPYFKGTTFKGIFREELERLITWSGTSVNIDEVLGKAGDDEQEGRWIFSDFVLSSAIRREILHDIGGGRPTEILDTMTNLRAFTKINEKGIAEEGSLRMARCVNRGLIFYSEIQCPKEDEATVEEVLGLIKWVGTMRNRGFGKVLITRVEG